MISVLFLFSFTSKPSCCHWFWITWFKMLFFNVKYINFSIRFSEKIMFLIKSKCCSNIIWNTRILFTNTSFRMIIIIFKIILFIKFIEFTTLYKPKMIFFIKNSNWMISYREIKINV